MKIAALKKKFVRNSNHGLNEPEWFDKPDRKDPDWPIKLIHPWNFFFSTIYNSLWLEHGSTHEKSKLDRFRLWKDHVLTPKSVCIDFKFVLGCVIWVKFVPPDLLGLLIKSKSRPREGNHSRIIYELWGLFLNVLTLSWKKN